MRRRRRWPGLLLVLLTCAAGPMPVSAQVDSAGAPPAGALEAAARSQIAAALRVPVERVAVVLPRVSAEADAALSFDSVRVRAGEGGRWMLSRWQGGHSFTHFVQVGVLRRVEVAAHDLPRGHVVTVEDRLFVERVDWTHRSEAEASPPCHVGMVTERRIREGEVLASPAVRPPLLVRGGEQVDALMRGGGLELRLRGEALSSARLGERLFVRLKSGRRFEGTVVEAGLVRISGVENR